MPFEMRDEMVAVFIVDRLQKPKERALESATTKYAILKFNSGSIPRQSLCYNAKIYLYPYMQSVL